MLLHVWCSCCCQSRWPLLAYGMYHLYPTHYLQMFSGHLCFPFMSLKRITHKLCVIFTLFLAQLQCVYVSCIAMPSFNAQCDWPNSCLRVLQMNSHILCIICRAFLSLSRPLLAVLLALYMTHIYFDESHAYGSKVKQLPYSDVFFLSFICLLHCWVVESCV